MILTLQGGNNMLKGQKQIINQKSNKTKHE